MSGGSRLPMRTEDDVRAALVSLERHAPEAGAVLAAVRTGGAGRRGPGPGRLRAARLRGWPGRPRAGRLRGWPGRAGLLTGAAAAAAAAAAALAIALLPGGTQPGSRAVPPVPVSASGPGVPAAGALPAAASGKLPSAAGVGNAMLAAFSAASDDILYSTQTGRNGGVVVDVYQDWSWPAQPVPGQRQLWREAFSQRLSRTAPLKLTENDSFAYVTPRAAAVRVFGRLTVVCYAGTGQTGCGYGTTETPAGTWSRHDGRFVNPNPGLADLSPAALARDVVTGQWRVIRRTRLAGQPAIELTQTPAARIQYQRPTFLWVNARTYLPLRMISSAGQPVTTQTDWYYLQPSKASLALLRVTVPPGYPRRGGS